MYFGTSKASKVSAKNTRTERGDDTDDALALHLGPLADFDRSMHRRTRGDSA
jgi:hypothetical protein